MDVRVYPDKLTLGAAAAVDAAERLRRTLSSAGRARIVAATGASQFEFLDALTREPGLDWPAVEMFHLDEYVGLPAEHPASFRRYLMERLVRKTGIVRHHFLDGEGDLQRTCDEVGRALQAAPADVAFVGIGENGHLAFNDPPADFETRVPYLVVRLDEACRRQQLGEGWFARLDDVPERAISMSIRQILEARSILCVAPDARKARAVLACLEGEVTPLAPASILRTHADVTVYLDRASASLLRPETVTAACR